MRIKEFVGRKNELTVLDRLWQQEDATMLVLSGRRRIGKTRLLVHWLQRNPEAGLYWMAEPTSATDQLRSFSQSLMRFVDPETEMPSDFQYATWEQALGQLATFAKFKRMAIFIDEITYIIDANPDFTGTFQKLWDHRLSQSNLLIALSGSQMGMIEKHLLSYDAPLYGRADQQMSLPPLPFSTTEKYFPMYSAEERLMLSAIWGGVPAYWERVDPKMTALENLADTILPRYNWMVDEARILLQDFVQDVNNFVATLRAVAMGKQTLTEIANHIGIANTKVSFYLGKLRDTGFVKRIVPITKVNTNHKRGRYVITDPYLRFFYRYISPYQSQLALGQIDYVLDLILKDIDSFLQDNTWAEICRDWVLLAGVNGVIPSVDNVGEEWGKNKFMNVVGIDNDKSQCVVGQAYWRSAPAGKAEIDDLIDKVSFALTQEKVSITLLAFSSSGWQEDAQSYFRESIELLEKVSKKRKWTIEGCKLLDLDQVDKDLIKWIE